MKKSLSFFALLLLLFCFAFIKNAAAAKDTANKPIVFSGITVTPAVNRIDLVPGQSEVNYNISVINNTSAKATLRAQPVDFKSLNDSGGIAFINSTSRDVNYKYGLSKWLTIEPQEFTVGTNKSQVLTVKITNSQDLTPGGHYAAILFQNQNDRANRGETHVDVNQVVSSLVFIQKLGGEKYNLSLRPIKQSTAWFNLPSIAKLFFTNTGNIQSAPYGLVTILNSSGNEVARGQINTDASMVLPDSTRYFRTEINKTSRSIWPGYYTLRATYHPDGAKKDIKVAETKFLYINLPFVLLTIFVVASICYFSLKIYKKRSQK